jgi:hypothetical protein
MLNETMKCVTNGATKSDLWRYLVLYGDIYTDIDNSPVKFNKDTISNMDDSLFVIEALGILSQFFMASSPSHPLMELELKQAMTRLRTTPNVMNNNPSVTTGLGALKVGYIKFMFDKSDGCIPAGTYFGVEERSVTAIGSKSLPREYIDRLGLGDGAKKRYYRAMEMDHFFVPYNLPYEGTISCLEHLKRTEGANYVANYVHNGQQYVDGGRSLHTK